ncbi:MAG: NFACT RNA binding domain-containing protein, partial [Spirochaetota bacterium]
SSPYALFENIDFPVLGKDFASKIKNYYLHKKQPAKKPTRKTPYLKFITKSGKEVLVGRNSQENENLFRRVARGNDMWFHVEEGQGSHVVLRYDKNSEFTEQDITDACMLALYFSKQRQKQEGSVVYTYCKFVQKPRKSPPGHVIYIKNKTRYVVLDKKEKRGQAAFLPKLL